MLELLLPVNPRKRVDSRHHWAAIAASLVACADWATGAITVTHAAVGAAAGARCGRSAFSHDTVGRVVDDLVAAGVLVCPPGLGGKSRAAFGGRGRNQCPTYFVVDPDAASADADLRTPPSHVSETVPVVGTTSLYKGPISPKFAAFDPSAVPVTKAERARAAEWLRSELHAGVIPNWAMAAMLARQFSLGLSPRQIFRRVCAGPGGTREVGPLPVGDRARDDALARSRHRDAGRMLLAMIGGRLRLWGDAPLAGPAARPAPLAAEPAPPPARPAEALRQRMAADIAAGLRARRRADAAFRAGGGPAAAPC